MAMGVKGTRDGIVGLVDIFGGASDERPKRIFRENSTVTRRDKKRLPDDVKISPRSSSKRTE